MTDKVVVTRVAPEPRPATTTIRFPKEKLIEALEWWCAAQGISIPSGERYLYGLETRYGQRGPDSYVELEVKEKG
jgi:hypothetical protein